MSGCILLVFLPAASYTFNNEHSLPYPGESTPGQCTPYFYKHFPNIWNPTGDPVPNDSSWLDTVEDTGM